MILSGHQPCYLPGIQLINKIMLSDAFMHVGHCQYQKQSWHSHNFIRTGELIVPVHATLGQSIDDVEIDYSKNWQRKHIRNIEAAYRGFQYFDDYFPTLEQIINFDCWRTLGELNKALLDYILEEIGIKTPILDSSDYQIEGAKTDMLISMCKAVGADEYLSNEGSRWREGDDGYITPTEEDRMAAAGIKHRWQKFTHPIYGQNAEVNFGRLSVIDLMFRWGPESAEIIRRAGHVG
jgi:hypothetical protein